MQRYVRNRLQVLERPFTEMDEDERQRCLARIRPELSRVDEFLPHAVATLNEIRHELRYVVTLQRGNLTLELQRRVPSGQDHLLSVTEVETWKRQDRDELQATFERMLELAGDFDLQQLGHKRLTELLMLEPGRMRKAVRAARREHEERMAFAVLLENNPRFVHYHKLYPARRLTRRWIALLGPTNSGKTHRSIEAMAAAEHAIYLRRCA